MVETSDGDDFATRRIFTIELVHLVHSRSVAKEAAVTGTCPRIAPVKYQYHSPLCSVYVSSRMLLAQSVAVLERTVTASGHVIHTFQTCELLLRHDCMLYASMAHSGRHTVRTAAANMIPAQ